MKKRTSVFVKKRAQALIRKAKGFKNQHKNRSLKTKRVVWTYSDIISNASHFDLDPVGLRSGKERRANLRRARVSFNREYKYVKNNLKSDLKKGIINETTYKNKVRITNLELRNRLAKVEGVYSKAPYLSGGYSKRMFHKENRNKEATIHKLKAGHRFYPINGGDQIEISNRAVASRFARSEEAYKKLRRVRNLVDKEKTVNFNLTTIVSPFEKIYVGNRPNDTVVKGEKISMEKLAKAINLAPSLLLKNNDFIKQVDQYNLLSDLFKYGVNNHIKNNPTQRTNIEAVIKINTKRLNNNTIKKIKTSTKVKGIKIPFTTSHFSAQKHSEIIHTTKRYIDEFGNSYGFDFIEYDSGGQKVKQMVNCGLEVDTNKGKYNFKTALEKCLMNELGIGFDEIESELGNSISVQANRDIIGNLAKFVVL